MAKSKIVVIKTLQRKLGMDDAAYRDGLELLTGRRSSTELTDTELDRVLAWLRETEQRIFRSTKGQVALIRHLWDAMYRYSVVSNGSQEALNSYCRRMVRVPLTSCNPRQCQHLIECLKKWYRRSALPEHLEKLESLAMDKVRNVH